MPATLERRRLSLGFLLLGAFFLILAVVYPALVSRALERFGVDHTGNAPGPRR